MQDAGGPEAAIGVLADVVLLNRAIYGGSDELADRYLHDYDPAVDPSDAGIRTLLNAYDRYDLYLGRFGLRTLSSGDLGFAPSAVAAMDDLLPGDGNGLDRNHSYRGDLWRNHVQDVAGAVDAPFTDAAAVALAAVRDTGAGRTLHLVFRGTDADLGRDGEAGTGPGQVRYYEQLKPLIDQALAFAADPANGITQVVVSGHSLGGAMVDLFTLYDSAAFRALDGVGLQMIALASAGVDPAVLALRPDFDRALLQVGGDGAPRLVTPDGYTQVDHAGDIVRNPWRYDPAEHAAADPDSQQVAFTTAATSTLREHLHFEGGRIEIGAPTVDQYALSAGFETNFLAQHYASLYELNATAVAEALQAAGAAVADFDRVIALSGSNRAILEVSGTNNANGWGLAVDDSADYGAVGDDLLVVGLAGGDAIVTGTGDDLLDGGGGADSLKGGTGADTLLGGAGDDLLLGGPKREPAPETAASEGKLALVVGSDARAVAIEVDAAVAVATPASAAGSTGDDDRLSGGTGDDTLAGGCGADTLDGGAGDDRLLGGEAADLFVIDDGGGVDRLFDLGTDDRIAIRAGVNGTGIADANAVLARAIDTADGDVEIDLGAGNVLVIANFSTDRISDGLFVFY